MAQLFFLVQLVDLTTEHGNYKCSGKKQIEFVICKKVLNFAIFDKTELG